MDVAVVVYAAVVVDVLVHVLVLVAVAVVGSRQEWHTRGLSVKTTGQAAGATRLHRAVPDHDDDYVHVHEHVHEHVNDHDGVHDHVNEYGHVPRTGWRLATGD